jgi:hypothetical protein
VVLVSALHSFTLRRFDWLAEVVDARVACPGQPGGMHRYGVRIMMYEVHVCSLKDETSHELRH